MVDHDKQQILQKIEDDALANARQKAQDDARAELEAQPESQAPVSDEDNPTSGEQVPLDTASVTG
jgi:hypothetical protein